MPKVVCLVFVGSATRKPYCCSAESCLRFNVKLVSLGCIVAVNSEDKKKTGDQTQISPVESLWKRKSTRETK